VIDLLEALTLIENKQLSAYQYALHQGKVKLQTNTYHFANGRIFTRFA
jgi:hypothetical protein